MPWVIIGKIPEARGGWALIRVVYNGYIVCSDRGFYFQIRGAGVYWNMGVY